MITSSYIAAGLLGISGWMTIEINGNFGLPDGIFVARSTVENYNVATGGSTVEIERTYMAWRSGGYVFLGLPPTLDSGSFDVRAAIRSQPSKVGIGRRFGPNILVRSSSGKPQFTFEAQPKADQYSLGNLTYRRVKPISADQVAGAYFFSSLQTTPVPGGGNDPVGARIELRADGTYAASGLETAFGNTGVVGGYQQAGVVQGRFRISGYAISMSGGGRALSYPCFFDPDPAAKGEILLLNNLPFRRITR